MTFFKSKKPNDILVIVFPGKEYTCDMPLLYYCTETALQSGCDVINLNYASDDYKQIVNEVINENRYKNIVFASKSLGTIFAGETALQFPDSNITHFFLTPLAETIQYIGNFPVIIGDKDNFFASENIAYLPNVHVINGADHSLEIAGDCIQSVEVLKLIIGIWINVLEVCVNWNY